MKSSPSKKLGVALLLGLLLVPVFLHAASPPAFYISPTGSDANDGSLQHPFATLAKARDAVRPLTAKMTGDIVVEILKGDYPVSETISFTEQDSGKNGFRMIYKNHDGIGSARFIGGSKITDWTPYKDHIYQANVGAGLPFTTLYENGIRADMARWPKRTSPFATSRAGYLTSIEGKDGLHYQNNAPTPDGAALNPDADFRNAWIYFWDGGDGHRWSSGNRLLSPQSKITESLMQLKNNWIGGAPNSFLIEGSLGLLTQPGEFFYDKEKGILYYYSRFNGPINKQEIIMPKVVRILGLVGSSETTPVSNISFEGLAFLGTDRLPESGTADWADGQQASWDAAIYLKNATGIFIKNCKIADTGICGITTDSNTKGVIISGCLIEHTGFHGISLINGEGHTVSNSLIRYISELRGHGDGVSIMYDPKRSDGQSTSPDFCKHTLSHLDVGYVARAGIAIRGKNDLLEYVKAHDCVQDSGDQGAFYLVDPAENAEFRQCTSFHNFVDLSCEDRPPTAVYNDRDASNTSYVNVEAGDSQMFNFRHDPQKMGTLNFTNTSWDSTCNPRKNETVTKQNADFDKSKMEYSKIGITPDFPREFNDATNLPAIPLNFWAQAGNQQVTLHWTQVDRATSFGIYRGTSPSGPFSLVGTNAVPLTGWDTGTSYTDKGLKNNTIYYYLVTAVDAAGRSPTSLALKVTPNEKGTSKLTGTTLGSGGNAALAFDGNLTTYFDTQKGWAGLDLGLPCVITEIRYSPRSDNTDTTSRMCGGEFQGANDPAFTNPTTLYKVLGTKGGAGTPVMIPKAIYNMPPFRYVRYIGPDGKCMVGEIEFYGYPGKL